MNANDLAELNSGIYEVYSEVFSTISYSDLKSSSYDTFYNEDKAKEYQTSVSLTAMAELKPDKEVLSDIGQKNGATCIFTVPRYCLEQTTLSSKALKDLKKGRITFNNINYEILNVVPDININAVFLFYIFECKGENI